MHMSKDFERFELLRRRHLDDVLGLIAETIEQAAPDGSSLVEMADYHLSTGGKRLRALLPLAIAEIFEVAPERLIPLGAACELLHNATLVHDDLQDGDRTRRGADTVWVRYGEARAINLGDAMLYFTLMLARKLDFRPARRDALIDRLLADTIRVIDGQEREFLLQAEDTPSIEAYYAMVQG